MKDSQLYLLCLVIVTTPSIPSTLRPFIAIGWIIILIITAWREDSARKKDKQQEAIEFLKELRDDMRTLPPR